MLAVMVHDVLVVEDEEDIAVPLMRTLEREGYEVTRVSGGAEAVSRVVDDSPAVVILDLGLPDMDGLDVCRQMRAGGYDGGIIMVTARAGELDRVVGLTSAPTTTSPSRSASPSSSPACARSAPLLRGPAEDTTTVVTSSASRSTPRPPGAPHNDKEIALTAKEFDVLAVLASHHDKVVPRETLMNQVWDQNWYGSTKTLDVTIGRLRSKLEAAEAGEKVVAIRGVGFRLETGSRPWPDRRQRRRRCPQPLPRGCFASPSRG